MPQIEFNLPLPSFLIASKRSNSRIKKIKENKPRSFKKSLLVSTIIFFITLSILVVIGTTPDQWTNFYFYKLNPKAGAVELEKEYKSNFNAAESARLSANLEVDNAQKDSSNSIKLSNDDNQIKSEFANRDAAYSEMIRIDKQAENLNLPKEYKQFYKKRLDADSTDYNGFKVYSAGEGQMMDATLALEQFYEQYSIAFGDLQYFEVNGLDPNHVAQFNNTVQQANNYYQNIAAISDTSDIFTPGILQYIQTSDDAINMFRKLNDAIINNDQQKAQEIVNQFYNTESVSNQDIYSLFGDWYKQKSLPFQTKQNDLHNQSWELYKEAYLYAKDSNLSDILKLWKTNPPGVESGQTPI